MNTKNIFSFICVVSFFGLVVFLSSCSELKSDLPGATTASKVHPDGWATPGASFHGIQIRTNNWDMTGCRSCHGNSYAGGTAGVSCNACHQGFNGPEGCAVCHGTAGVNAAPPRDLTSNTLKTARGVGAHQIHFLGSTIAANTICSECHVVPGDVYKDPSHLDGNPGAEVQFLNPLTRLATSGVTPSPAYNSATMTCSGTYCHGTFKNGNLTFAPIWNDASGAQMACGTCHGDVTQSTLALKALPGGTHPVNTACSTCHGGVVDASLKIINPSKHVDGKLNLSGNDISF